MLENVSEDGKELSGCLGRQQNPGERQGRLGATQEEGNTEPCVLGFRCGECLGGRLEEAEERGWASGGWGFLQRSRLPGPGSSEPCSLLGREQRGAKGFCSLCPLPQPQPHSSVLQPSPGHALEAGWFLLRHCIRKGDPELRAHVLDKFLLLPFRSGWDPDHGGLFYFQDADDFCPTQVGEHPGPCVTHADLRLSAWGGGCFSRG